jgi:hypothetical protein
MRFDPWSLLLDDIMIPGDAVDPINCITRVLLPAVVTLDVTVNTPMCKITWDFLAITLLGTGFKLPGHQRHDPYSDERLVNIHLRSHLHIAMSTKMCMPDCGVNMNISEGNHIVHRADDFI